MSEKYRQFDASFVHLPPDRAYENVRQQVPPFSPRGGKRGRPSAGRKAYQDRRMDTHRAVKSKITEDQLSEELKKKLFPGVKDGQTAADRLEAVNTLKAITLCVTTRSIGFGTLHMFSCLYQFNNVPVQGSIYEMYRVCLAVFEVKVKIVQRGITAIEGVPDDYEDIRMAEDLVVAAKGVIALPDQITSVINAIGRIKVYDSVYVPKIGRNNQTVGGEFIPQTEQVTFSNLRRVVESLADIQTPPLVRLRFYNNNPIPGAVWNDAPLNPVLMNADEIMPANYTVTDFRDDVHALHAKMNFLAKKAPKYFTKPVSFEVEGSKSMLVCNKQESLRCSDRRIEQREEGRHIVALPDYYQTAKVEGDVEEFYNLIHLTTGEQVEGNITLLGETPQSNELKYPIYLNRDERACIEYSNLSYKAARNIKYT